MANKAKANVKRFAEDISRKMAEDAYNGGGGGGSVELIDFSQNSTITLDCKKLLDVLIAKDVDVDAEFEYSWGSDSGITVGMLFPKETASSVGSNGLVEIYWSEDSGDVTATFSYSESKPIEPTSSSIKDLLTATDTISYTTSEHEDYKILPVLQVLTSSSEGEYAIIAISTEEFLSFCTITTE